VADAVVKPIVGRLSFEPIQRFVYDAGRHGKLGEAEATPKIRHIKTLVLLSLSRNGYGKFYRDHNYQIHQYD